MSAATDGAAKAQQADSVLVAVPQGVGAGIDFVLHVHSYINDCIRFADTKAGLILAACSFLFGLPLSNADKLGVIFSHTPRWQGAELLIVSGLLYVALTVSALSCVLCVLPRLGSPGKSKIYFGDIAVSEASAKVYAAHIAGCEPRELLQEVAVHVFVLSQLAMKKYAHVRRATLALAMVIVLSTLLTISFTVVYVSTQVSPAKTPPVTSAAALPGLTRGAAPLASHGAKPKG